MRLSYNFFEIHRNYTSNILFLAINILNGIKLVDLKWTKHCPGLFDVCTATLWLCKIKISSVCCSVGKLIVWIQQKWFYNVNKIKLSCQENNGLIFGGLEIILWSYPGSHAVEEEFAKGVSISLYIVYNKFRTTNDISIYLDHQICWYSPSHIIAAKKYEKDRRIRFNALLDRLASVLPDCPVGSPDNNWTKAQVLSYSSPVRMRNHFFCILRLSVSL